MLLLRHSRKPRSVRGMIRKILYFPQKEFFAPKKKPSTEQQNTCTKSERRERKKNGNDEGIFQRKNCEKGKLERCMYIQ